MNKRLTILLCLAAIISVLLISTSTINYRVDIANTKLDIQARKTNAVICQLNALRNRLFKLDDTQIQIQNAENDMRYHFSDVIDAIIPSVVEVKSYTTKGKTITRGAGFVIDADKGYIITAKHVIDYKNKKVVSINDLNVEILDIYPDEKEDFAILILDVNDPNYCEVEQLKLSTNVVRRGEFVISIGHPWAFAYSASLGIISNPNSEHNNYSLNGNRSLRIQFDAATNPGNSGGVIVDWYGDIVGLVTSIHFGNGGPHNAGVNFAVPVSEMKKCLKRFDKWLADKESKLQLEESL